ncbi:hypothetical protein ALC57_10037 [Trachymyrmex cornetzi]|uniref:Uncharacterized protein n=1 Tax=Trachymyrmex cornetzi TaxID=471704 RepID=A0A195DXR8_9HYME|nr:hypothetical protein ALC57_10037 [Trachymyrmex cornetzi]
MDTKIPDGPPGVDLHPTSKCPHVVLGVSSTATAQAHPDDGVHYLQQVFLNTCRELWTIPEGAIATTAANYFSNDQSKYISFGVVTQVKMYYCNSKCLFSSNPMSTWLSKNSVIPQASSTRSWISAVIEFIWDQVSLFRFTNMPRSRRRHRSRSHSRTRSHSVGSPQYEHKRRRIDYESPQSKGTYSGERVLRSRQHERGTSQERRYKRSHRRSPSSGRQHGHRDRERDRAHLAHPTSSRRTRLHRHHDSSSPSQERHRHRSPSTRSQCEFAPDGQRNIVAAAAAVIITIEERCAGKPTGSSKANEKTPSPIYQETYGVKGRSRPIYISERSASTKLLKTFLHLKRAKLQLICRESTSIVIDWFTEMNHLLFHASTINLDPGDWTVLGGGGDTLADGGPPSATSSSSSSLQTQELSLLMPGNIPWWPRHDWDAWLQRNVTETTRELDMKLDVTPETNDTSTSEEYMCIRTCALFMLAISAIVC